MEFKNVACQEPGEYGSKTNVADVLRLDVTYEGCNLLFAHLNNEDFHFVGAIVDELV